MLKRKMRWKAMSIKKDRTGEISYNKFGSKMVLIRYNQWDNVDVYFPDYN